MTTRVQGQRDVALVGLPFRGIAINDNTNNTTSVTVYASDSGILFINKKAGTTTYTLPAVEDCEGKVFFFMSYVANDLVIQTASGDDVLVGGSASAGIIGDKLTGGGTIGIWCAIIGDGTNYFALPGTGTWTYAT